MGQLPAVGISDSPALQSLAEAIVSNFTEEHPSVLPDFTNYREEIAIDPNYDSEFEELTGHGRM
jgi:hypothetical protein